MKNGFPDIPISLNAENAFHTETYVEVMTDFIKSCDTPMTIAIQGDWGTGKTSMMNMVKERLGKDVYSVFFNTWQYSQFNLGDQLPILLINKLVTELADEKKKKSIKDKLVSGAKLVGAAAAGYISQGTVSLNYEDFDFDQIEQLVNIREELQKIITEKAATVPAKRVVIFVDDLDRLQPQKSVEVLEVMKVFLDCRDCVFVLAVDYSVVSKGVSAKYGESMDDDKGRSFFDKIIQLPFKMPVAQYSIDGYLKRLMTNIWGSLEKDEEEDIRSYLQVLDCTIGKNPRSIKRTVNSFTIIDQVAGKEKAYEGDKELIKKQKQKLLFSLLCMQMSYEPLYNYVIQSTNAFKDEQISFLDELEDDETFYEKLKDIYGREIPMDSVLFKNLNTLIDIFVRWSRELMDALRQEKAGESAEDVFLKILTLSSITSSSDVKEQPESRKERTMYYLKLKHGDQVSEISFRSAMRNAASLGAMAYVLIKQFMIAHNASSDEVNARLKAGRISGAWLEEDESIVFPKTAALDFLQKSPEKFEHFLTHYFVHRYEQVLDELRDEIPGFEKGVDGMQKTFPPIQQNGESYFVARYWGESDIIKLISSLDLGEYVGYDPTEVKKEISAFDEQELTEMRQRKCPFRGIN